MCGANKPMKTFTIESSIFLTNKEKHQNDSSYFYITLLINKLNRQLISIKNILIAILTLRMELYNTDINNHKS